jgi:hypothetical protein
MSSMNPCEVAPGEFDHDYEAIDDSFDHEYGTQQVFYKRCKACGHEADIEAHDYE